MSSKRFYKEEPHRQEHLAETPMSPKEYREESMDQHTVRTSPTVGEKVPSPYRQTTWEIVAVDERGVYQLESGKDTVYKTERQVEKEQLAGSLIEFARSLVEAQEDTKGEGKDEKRTERIMDAVELLVSAMVSVNSDEAYLKSELTSVIQEMQKQTAGNENIPAFMLFAIFHNKTEAALEYQLNNLDYEPADVKDLVEAAGKGIEDTVSAITAGYKQGAAKEAAKLSIDTSEVIVQLTEEMRVSDDAPEVADTASLLEPVIRLTARVIGESDPELGKDMLKTGLELTTEIPSEILQDRSSEFEAITKRLEEEFFGEDSPEPQSELLPADPKATGKATRIQMPSRTAFAPATVGGTKMGGIAQQITRERRPVAETAMLSREQSEQAKEIQREEIGIADRVNRVSEFLNTEDGGLAIAGDPELETIKDINPNTYNEQRDLAVFGGFFARRSAKKEVARIDALMARAENLMQSVGRGSVGDARPSSAGSIRTSTLTTPTVRSSKMSRMRPVEGGDGNDSAELIEEEVTGELEPAASVESRERAINTNPTGRRRSKSASGGFSVELGGIQDRSSNVDRGRNAAGTLSPEQEQMRNDILNDARERGIDSRVDRVRGFLNSESGRLAIAGYPELGAIKDIVPDDYNEQRDLAVSGGFFARRGARKAIKQMDVLMAIAESMMESVSAGSLAGDRGQAGSASAGFNTGFGGTQERASDSRPKREARPQSPPRRRRRRSTDSGSTDQETKKAA